MLTLTPADLDAESLYVAAGAEGDQLHVRRIRPRGGGAYPPVLMAHGAIENGRIFYSAGGRGLAPFLAARGYDVYALDFRGRGLSRPHAGKATGARMTQTASITEDVPAVSALIARLTGGAPQHWLAHSWGGVLLASALVRFPELARRAATLTAFGTKRSISVYGLERLIGLDLVWRRLGPWSAYLYGYFPAVALRLGADDEPLGFMTDCVAWTYRRSAWVDPRDGFDYAAAARTARLPPTRHFIAADDPYLGHETDVRRFMQECGTPDAAARVLGKRTGYSRDYGHIDMLTHPDAPREHFNEVAAWLHEHPGAPPLIHQPR